ncbi:Hpt domain-containing protein [Thalassolituus sp.]|jgi:HPt (histidine-containing phosphotransfer) domain-containing protein|uniref:Hpt domain-containing protein n=1 Tax=Thalassolituus sp. TaxID=2030822 RepID=UPI002A825BFD|nr:Hpt domain-containing protein [Thalassolituus sp.]|tara:strand:- start:8911 stop:9246 length:336 start_codon:yes stop_codon:yes gene_type:complete
MDALDIEAIKTLQDIMEDEFDDLIDIYIRDADERIMAIRALYESQDAVALRMATHSFKGASSNVCALGLATIAQIIENAAHTGQLEGLQASIELLENTYKEVRHDLLALHS